MTLTLWSKTDLGDQITHFFRPSAAGNINPVFGYGVTANYSGTGDNNLYLSLSGQDFLGTIDDTPTLIGPYVANPSKVGGSAAGLLLFNNATANTPTVTGGAFWFNETAAGSNTYNVNYQNFNFSAPLVAADGPAISLSSNVVTLESNVSNVTSFNWDWTSSTFIFGFETTPQGSTARDIYLQGFTPTGAARGALTQVGTLGLGAIWDVKEASTTTDLYYHEASAGQNATFVAQAFTPSTGALTNAFTITTGLADLTAYNLAGNVYAFAGKDTAGNAKIEFDTINNSGAITASHSITLAGTTAAVRVVGTALPNNAGAVFAYTDPNDNQLHLVQVDESTNILQNLIVDSTNSSADRVRTFGDGRVKSSIAPALGR